MNCPLCGYQPMRITVDGGDPDNGYSGGEVKYCCPRCAEEFTDSEMEAYANAE